jgi:predicted membrane chloride channel (bestrophin family)
VSLTLPMPRARQYATDDIAREVAARVLRPFLAVLGVLIALIGVLIAPLPGPGGLPVIVLGLMLVLRNSFKARRQFVKFQRAHPKMVFPIRRLLRRDPEVVAVAWQQTLRIERLVLPMRYRFFSRMRRRVRRKLRR